MKTLLVTRHNGLAEYLFREGLLEEETTDVVSHVTPDLVKGRDVWGVLPHSLSCLAATFTEVPLRLTPEMRGRELTADDVAAVAGSPVTYKVRVVK